MIERLYSSAPFCGLSLAQSRPFFILCNILDLPEFLCGALVTTRNNMGKSRNTDKYGKFKDFRKKTKNHNHKKSDYKFDEPHYQPKYNMDDTVEMPMEDLENLS